MNILKNANLIMQYKILKPSVMVQWILVSKLTVYYVISVITLETGNTKPFLI